MKSLNPAIIRSTIHPKCSLTTNSPTLPCAPSLTREPIVIGLWLSLVERFVREYSAKQDANHDAKADEQKV
jgi:hypothetical protein